MSMDNNTTPFYVTKNGLGQRGAIANIWYGEKTARAAPADTLADLALALAPGRRAQIPARDVRMLSGRQNRFSRRVI